MAEREPTRPAAGSGVDRHLPRPALADPASDGTVGTTAVLSDRSPPARLDVRDEHLGDAERHGRAAAPGHGQGGHRDGHGAGHGDHAATFRDRLWVALILSVPVVAYSPMIQDRLGYRAP